MIREQFILDINDVLLVDNFAGGGGASTGIELALGRHVDIAVNHDPEAVAMHQANHPQTLHLCESVFDVDPVAVTKGRRVGLLWLSPDCKHFSKAKGGKPREKRIRGLAWVALNWVTKLKDKQPRLIFLENVEEFQTWGPVDKNGTPHPSRKGATFRSFVGALYRRGYAVEWRELRACDYGAPTIRKRLFLIARCDGEPIVWPTPTHGDPKKPETKARKLKPWRTAAECIDWTLPCPSIFTRKRPLAEATCRRIAKGIMRYVVNNPRPFIVPLTHHGKFRGTELSQPLPTVTAAHRGEQALVAPVVAGLAHGDHKERTSDRSKSCEQPVGTIHAGGNNFALVAPTLAVNTSKHTGGRPDEPLKTVCAEGTHHMLVAPVLTEHANAKHERNFDPKQPLRTQCAQVKGGHFALTQAFLAKHYGGVVGSEVPQPIGTVTSTDHHSLVTGCLVPRYGERPGQEPRALDVAVPAPTVVPTANGGSLVAAHLSKFRGTSTAQAADAPMHTVSAGGNHLADVRAFLIKYYGNEKDAHQLRDPAGTVTTKDRFGLVTIHGEEYAIADIGLRMLAPRELFRAQGFPDSYIIGDDGRAGLELTKSAQVRMCGNSVCPPLAAALVRANAPELSRWERKECVA